MAFGNIRRQLGRPLPEETYPRNMEQVDLPMSEEAMAPYIAPDELAINAATMGMAPAAISMAKQAVKEPVKKDLLARMRQRNIEKSDLRSALREKVTNERLSPEELQMLMHPENIELMKKNIESNPVATKLITGQELKNKTGLFSGDTNPTLATKPETPVYNLLGDRSQLSDEAIESLRTNIAKSDVPFDKFSSLYKEHGEDFLKHDRNERMKIIRENLRKYREGK